LPFILSIAALDDRHVVAGMMGVNRLCCYAHWVGKRSEWMASQRNIVVGEILTHLGLT
jgi:hypothetical protein